MHIIIFVIVFLIFYQHGYAQTNLNVQGSSNQISIEQIETGVIKGSAGPEAIIGGDFNQISIFQGIPGYGINQIELHISNNNNIVDIRQARDEFNLAHGTNGHRISLISNGFGNNFSSKQTNDDIGQHVIFSSINGNGNTLSLTQKNDNTKILTLSVTGNNNQIQSLQEGVGAHQANLNLFGTGHNVILNQKGSGNHSADLSLTNVGGAISVNLLQQGNQNQTYSLIQTCGIPTGCVNTIVQGQ